MDKVEEGLTGRQGPVPVLLSELGDGSANDGFLDL